MKFTASIEIEVESDKEFTEAEGKRAAYALAATLNNQVKRGRTPSGPTASVVGIVVQSVVGINVRGQVVDYLSVCRNPDAME